MTNITENIVDVVTIDKMDGEGYLEKLLNSYLTTHFIGSKDIPSDECLGIAKDIIGLIREFDKLDPHEKFLKNMRYTSSDQVFKQCVKLGIYSEDGQLTKEYK
jgi:hypothetical protein